MPNLACAAMNIPLFRQARNRFTCLPTSMRMLLAYFGHTLTLKQILKTLPSDQYGTYLEEAGTFFLQRKFSATYLGFLYEPRLDYLDLPSNKVPSVIGGWYRRNTSKRRSTSFRRFMKHGGIHLPRPIGEHDLRHALASKFGVILGLSHGYLRGGQNEVGEPHAVVASKISRTRIWVNDPYVGVTDYSIAYLLLASYEYGGQALIVKPKP